MSVTPTMSAVLHRAATRYGERTALVIGGRSLSYRELDQLSDQVAGGLAARGVRPGDVVSLYSGNRWEWVVAYHGIMKAGAVVNPINVMLTPEEVAFVTGDCGARAIIASGDRAAAVLGALGSVRTLETVIAFDDAAGAESFAELLDGRHGPPDSASPDPGSVCTIAYTSGTTGHPKGALQSHRAVFLNCALTATMHVRTREDVVLTGVPAAHVYGNVVVNGTFMAGGTVVLMERFDAGAALEMIGAHRVTLFEGVPTMYAMMLAHPDLGRAELGSLTRSTVGGQTIPTPVIEAWEARSGAPMIELWGMTELAGLGTTHALYAENVHGSIGVALPGIEVKVAPVDDPRAVAPPGEPGELMVRGSIVMLGYHGNEAATRETIEPDGWLHTGDVAWADEHGRFFIVDRVKDMLITGGYNVYPAEIERVVAGHPAVAMVAVGAVPDDVRGELARAYVVLRPGATAGEQEIIEFCRLHLAAYKLPRSVTFVPDLPKTSSGKIMRRKLRELDGDGGVRG